MVLVISHTKDTLVDGVVLSLYTFLNGMGSISQLIYD
jgi:hypothetical protein